MLDAHGEKLATMVMIERHQHEAMDGFGGAIAKLDGLLGRPCNAGGLDCEPADFYAGLRHCPPVSKWWFFFASRWFK